MASTPLRLFATSASQKSKKLIGLLPADGIGKEVVPVILIILPFSFLFFLFFFFKNAISRSHFNEFIYLWKACKDVLDAVGAPFDYVNLEAGFELFQKTGVALPQKTVDILKNECQGSIFGAVRF